MFLCKICKIIPKLSLLFLLICSSELICIAVTCQVINTGDQGPVVQSIFSLMSLSRHQFVMLFTTFNQIHLHFLLKKASHIFSTKNIGAFDI